MVTGVGFIAVTGNANFSVYVRNCSNCADYCLIEIGCVVFLSVQFPPW